MLVLQGNQNPMAASPVPLQSVPDEYPNALADSAPQRVPLRLPFALLVILIGAAFLPRALMAWRIPSVVADGVFYIHLAQSLDRGDVQGGLVGMSLNTYPVILMILHRTGLDWETAGVWWGVGIASLVVLPLYGWIRRQFDDRVALVACLLYALHPRMIQWSPEVIRDPTFWFLLMLAIYLLWRAVTEVRLLWFAAAGITLSLAAFTRSEGLFLLIPFALWSFWRWRALTVARGRLPVGLVVAALAFPSLIAVVAVLWFRSETLGHLFRVDPIVRAWAWAEHTLGRPVESSPLAAAGVNQPLSFGQMLWVFFPTVTRGLSPVFGLLMLGGMWGWRTVWARRDHQAVFCMGMTVLAGIWIQLWYDKAICPRYALPIVLFGAPFAALALLGLIHRLARLAARFHAGPRLGRAVLAAPFVLLAAFGLADAMTSYRTYFQSRKAAVELGDWIHREVGSPPMLVGPAPIAPIVSYYAHGGQYRVFRFDTEDPAEVAELVQEWRPDLFLLEPTKHLSPEQCRQAVEQVRAMGMEPVDPGRLPPGNARLQMLVRPPAVCRRSQEPAATR